MSVLNKLTTTYLKKNKRRTIVTIIGIIIAVSMITAVSILGESSKKILVDTEKVDSGDFESIIYNVPEEKRNIFLNNGKFEIASPFSLVASINVDYDKKEERKVLETEDDEAKDGEVEVNLDTGEKRTITEKDKKGNLVQIPSGSYEIFFSKVIEGRLPEKTDEVIINQGNMYLSNERQVKIGDEIVISDSSVFHLPNISSEEKVNLSQLKQNQKEFKGKKFKIVGKTFDGFTNNFTVIQFVHKESELVGNIGVGLVGKNKSNFISTVKNMIDEQKIQTVSEKKVEEIKKFEPNLTKKQILETEKLNEGIYIESNEGYYIPYGYAFEHMKLFIYDTDSNYSDISKTILGIQILLYVVIGAATALVIYNSFTISISERKRQFGMLISIGATKKQIRRMVMIEAFYMAAIGIILGIIIGFAGIYLTINIINILLRGILANQGMPNPELIQLVPVITLSVIILTVITSIIIIYISILIPAIKAAKTSPVEAIRGVNEIKIKKKKVKTSKISKKLIGIEGDLAQKSLKRSKGKYRITVLSLIVSIVLFLFISNFVNLTFDITDTNLDKNSLGDNNIIVSENMSYKYKDESYDYNKLLDSFLSYPEEFKDEYNISVIQDMNTFAYSLKLDELNTNKYAKEKYFEMVDANLKREIDFMEREHIPESVKENRKKELEKEKQYIPVQVITYKGKQYEKFLKDNNLDELKNNEAFLFTKIETTANKKAYNLDLIKEQDNLILYRNIGYEEIPIELKNLDIKYLIRDSKLPLIKNSRFVGLTLIINVDTAVNLQKEALEKIQENVIEKYLNVDVNKLEKTELYYNVYGDLSQEYFSKTEEKTDSYGKYRELTEKEEKHIKEETLKKLKEITQSKEKIIETLNLNEMNYGENSYFYITSLFNINNAAEKKATEKIEEFGVNKILKFKEKDKNFEGYVSTTNIEQMIRTVQAVKTIIYILLYGFIVLIVLIAMSNVFNTISTNILLRQREFANLKSIGMTPKQMRKMMNYESILYGVKAIFYGILTSYILLLILKKIIGETVEMQFSFSLLSIIIVIVAVMLIVYITMIYSRKQIEKQNIIDIIKKENI